MSNRRHKEVDPDFKDRESDPVKACEAQLYDLNIRLAAAEKRLAEFDDAALNGRFPMQRLHVRADG